MSKRVRRKELKGPDEFISLTQRALEYAKQNEREVTFAVLALVALVGAALGVRAYRGWQLARAEEALGRAYREMTENRLDRAAEGFTAVASGWPSTPPGELALLYLGNCEADLGRDEEAKASFTGLIGRTRDEALLQIAHYNLGMLKRKAEDTAGAMEEFRAAGTTVGPLQGAAWFAGVRIRERLGKADERPPGEEIRAVSEGLPAEVREYLAARVGGIEEKP